MNQGQIFLIDRNRPADQRYAFADDLKVVSAPHLSRLRISIAIKAPLPMEFLLDSDAAAALVNGITQILVLDGGHMIYVTEAAR